MNTLYIMNVLRLATVWHFAVVMELPDSLWMNCKSEFIHEMTLIFFSKKNESDLLKVSFNIEYSCHTITNIKHGRQLSLQLMTNLSLTCNYSNAHITNEETMFFFWKCQKKMDNNITYVVRLAPTWQYFGAITCDGLHGIMKLYIDKP